MPYRLGAPAGVTWEWIEEAGRFTFGRAWQHKMARALGCGRSTIQRWNPACRDGHYPITRAHYLHIRHLMQLKKACQPIALE